MLNGDYDSLSLSLSLSLFLSLSETISMDENILSPGVDSVLSVDANLSPNTPSLSLNGNNPLPFAIPSAPSLGSDNANPLSMPSLLSQVSPSVDNDTQLLSARGLSDGDDGDFMKRVYGEIKSLPQLLSPLYASSCQSPLPVHCLPSELHSPRMFHTLFLCHLLHILRHKCHHHHLILFHPHKLLLSRLLLSHLLPFRHH